MLKVKKFKIVKNLPYTLIALLRHRSGINTKLNINQSLKRKVKRQFKQILTGYLFNQKYYERLSTFKLFKKEIRLIKK